MSCEHDFESNEESEYCHLGCGEKWSIWVIKSLRQKIEQRDALLERAERYMYNSNPHDHLIFSDRDQWLSDYKAVLGG